LYVFRYDGKIDEVRSYPAIVEERVSLPGRTISRNTLPWTFCSDQDSRSFPFRLLHFLREVKIVLEGGEPPIDFPLAERRQSGRLGMRVSAVWRAYTRRDRRASDLVHVEDGQPVPPQRSPRMR